MKSRVQSYIDQFSQVFNGIPWLDESFAKKLNNLTEDQALTQCPGKNHSVAEVVSHLLEWRKEVLRRLTENSSERRITDKSPENWKPLKQLRETGWAKLHANFIQSQQQVLDVLKDKDDSFLEEQLGDLAFNKEYFVAGLLHHDLYHLGQIGLILKWVK